DGKRFTMLHAFVSISTISLDLLHATHTRVLSREGWAHVGEHDTSPGFGGSMPCPPISCVAPAVSFPRSGGDPVIPISFPFVRKKWRLSLSVRSSISTSASSIMHAE